MRIKNDKIDIDYNNTYEFFKNRAEKFKEDKPYCATMYQDNNPGLAVERDKTEKARVLPYLNLNEKCRVMDIGCGIGRWADELKDKVNYYLGIDFNEDLINIASKRVVGSHIYFQKMSAVDIGNKESLAVSPPFNRFIISGVLLYLNDHDVLKCLMSVEQLADKDAIIYIREPIGIDYRLTLDKFYSEELDTTYNAIYRTREDYKSFFEEALINKDFFIKDEGFMFEKSLVNRAETSQYYFILERN